MHPPAASGGGSAPPPPPDGCGPDKSPPCRRRTLGTGSYCGSAGAVRRPRFPPRSRRCRPIGSGHPEPAGAWPTAPRRSPDGGSRSRRSGHSRDSPAPAGGGRCYGAGPACRRPRFSAPSSPECRSPRPGRRRGRTPPARRCGPRPAPRWSSPRWYCGIYDFSPMRA